MARAPEPTTEASLDPYPAVWQPPATPVAPPRRRTTRGGRGRPASRSRPPSRRGRRPARPSILLGVVALACFMLFWAFMAIAMGQVFEGLASGDFRHLAGAAGLSLVALALPVVGVVVGAIGCFATGSHRAVAAVGTGLNLLLLAWLASAFGGGHRQPASSTAVEAAAPGR